MSIFSLVPLWARLLLVVVTISSVWVLGEMHGRAAEAEAKDLLIAANQHAYDARIHAADVALVAANQRAAEASQGATTDQAAISAAYQKGKTDAALVTNARVADYAAGRQRMRVDATCRPADAGGGRELPRAPAAARGPDAAPVADVVELRPDAARRVAAAAGEVEALARQVIALQALAQSEHDRCNQVSAPEPAVPARRAPAIVRGALVGAEPPR